MATVRIPSLHLASSLTWADHFTAWCLSFLISLMEKITALDRAMSETTSAPIYQAPGTVLGTQGLQAVLISKFNISLIAAL